MSNDISQSANGDNNLQVAIKNYYENSSNISSLLAEVMPDVAKVTNTEIETSNDSESYDIDEKIEHNNVQSFIEILNEFGQYGIKIDDLYEEYDNAAPGFKKSIYKYFRTKYLLKKQKYCAEAADKDPMEVVRSQADKVLNEITIEFVSELKSSNNLRIKTEELEACAVTIVCHAFINCKILEKPNANS